ncbi:muconolactone Delta-isomerase [Microbacterium sp. SSM24]|uniref:muconolactone Delta-isomerase n=1 Tax=Microbacterium sp. SSM24 TaxID=2991714 RepID=UPI0022276E22|nr:muconolactone Delta-isomerase [Microbacterium sp. SSM24]MCW3492653.1 muconolactone Delta-isomerase [Microbacterium sp. SSM24]
MLYHVRMDVHLPVDLDPATAQEIKDRERAYSQELQRDGRWRELWRVVGEYSNISIFDVSGNDELQELLSALPLFPYMRIRVTPLAQHPSRISPPDQPAGAPPQGTTKELE